MIGIKVEPEFCDFTGRFIGWVGCIHTSDALELQSKLPSWVIVTPVWDTPGEAANAVLEWYEDRNNS